MKKLFVWLLIFSLLSFNSCTLTVDIGISDDRISKPTENENSGDVSKPSPEGTLRVHFLDVGQGDSVFAELPNGETLLIDCGEYEYAGRIISFIDCLGYKKIDHLVATHPHADHIGGMQKVVENFDIGSVYMPEAVANTKTFINLLETLDSKGLSITPVTAGLKVDLGGASGMFVAPVLIVDDLNNCSAVLKLEFGESSFLFTGDAEIAEEDTIKLDISCDVLKVGHHGSSTSSGKSFLSRCNASYAVISCGKDNSYGHPHKEALERLNDAGVEQIYRTDISGTVTVETDGKTISFTEGLVPDGYKWVLNISSKKLHTPECSGATGMAEKNRAYSKRSLDILVALGYELCGSCDPE